MEITRLLLAKDPQTVFSLAEESERQRVAAAEVATICKTPLESATAKELPESVKLIAPVAATLERRRELAVPVSKLKNSDTVTPLRATEAAKSCLRERPEPLTPCKLESEIQMERSEDDLPILKAVV